MLSGENPHAVIERMVREEWGRVLAILIKQIRDFELAEDALQDALIVALDQWKPGAIPENPFGWLLKVARRKMIDQVRRRESFRSKEEAVIVDMESVLEGSGFEGMNDDEPIPDERLRLMFTCCHPALAKETRVGLTLQTLSGLTTAEIAKAYLIPESTMAQRLVRAKRKIKAANIPYKIPGLGQLEERFTSILSVIYLIFNEGYAASSGVSAMRTDLADESIRLARILVRLAPDQPEARGLLALMLLHHSRSPARFVDGEMVTLEHQDRARWNHEMIDEGTLQIEKALGQGKAGPYQLQAAISAVHTEAKTNEATDWKQIYLLYAELYKLQPSPVVELNGIVALSFAGGPEAALDAIAKLSSDPKMEDYVPFHAAVADISRRAEKTLAAIDAYQVAISLTENEADRRFFENRVKEIERDD